MLLYICTRGVFGLETHSKSASDKGWKPMHARGQSLTSSLQQDRLLQDLGLGVTGWIPEVCLACPRPHNKNLRTLHAYQNCRYMLGDSLVNWK